MEKREPVKDHPVAASPLKRVTGYANVCLALLVGAILIRSAYYHVENPYAFLSAVLSYPLFTDTIATAIAIFLPYFMLTIGVALYFFQSMRRQAFLCAAVLFFMFTVVQGVVGYQGIDIPCACFSPADSHRIDWSTIAFSWACWMAATIGSFTVANG
jgi:hypothetical protein